MDMRQNAYAIAIKLINESLGRVDKEQDKEYYIQLLEASASLIQEYANVVKESL